VATFPYAPQQILSPIIIEDDSFPPSFMPSISMHPSTSSPTLPFPRTHHPTYSPTVDAVTTFYPMADCPYDDEERYDIMPKYIADLDDDNEFMVHLGDWQYAKVDNCREGAYKEASAILKKSSIPVLVLPG